MNALLGRDSGLAHDLEGVGNSTRCCRSGQCGGKSDESATASRAGRHRGHELDEDKVRETELEGGLGRSKRASTREKRRCTRREGLGDKKGDRTREDERGGLKDVVAGQSGRCQQRATVTGRRSEKDTGGWRRARRRREMGSPRNYCPRGERRERSRARTRLAPRRTKAKHASELSKKRRFARLTWVKRARKRCFCISETEAEPARPGPTCFPSSHGFHLMPSPGGGAAV